MTFLRFVTLTLWNYYVLKLLLLETITFSDATLSDINVVLCYILSKYCHEIEKQRKKLEAEKVNHYYLYFHVLEM